MRFNKLDLNQLAVLDAILSTRSVSRAATRLRLSQPATSCALKRLREYFSDDLLVPVGKVYVLTPLAAELRKPVRDVLLHIQAITRTRPKFDPTTSTRRFTIESSDYIVSVFLSEVLRRVGERAPLMQFDLRPLSPHTAEHLENGDVEIVFTPEPFGDHPCQPLFEDGFTCSLERGARLQVVHHGTRVFLRCTRRDRMGRRPYHHNRRAGDFERGL